MVRFTYDGRNYGIVGCAVGASFAVLLAEQMFVSGCRLLLSVTSSGQIKRLREPSYFILIERALRDEGTSYHYLPADRDYAVADPALVAAVTPALAQLSTPVERGASWTTDAPYRETPEVIDAARADGTLAVEMEAAAPYAFAEVRRKPVLCFAHITNQMGQAGDFEKGEANGAIASIGFDPCRRRLQATVAIEHPTERLSLLQFWVAARDSASTVTASTLTGGLPGHKLMLIINYGL